MNVLFITSTLPRFVNDGQSPFVLEQAFAWNNTFSEDKVFILAPHDSRAKTNETIEGVTVTRFRYWWPASHQKLAYPAILPNIQKRFRLVLQLPALIVCEFWAARKLLKRQGIDFIFAHWLIPQGLVAYLLHRSFAIPYGVKNYSSDLRVFKRIPLIGPMLARRIIRSSVRLICENSMLRQEAIDLFPNSERSQREDQIAALSMGVSHGSGERTPSDFSQARCDFAFIGRLSKKKGLDHLIRALTALHNEGIRFKARIAGTGEEEPRLLKMCDIPEVEFVGHVSGERKEAFFRQSKFLVFPSSPSNGDIEGLPVAILEALYLGKIVIASRATNIHLLPEWKELHARVYLLEDPRNVSEFAGLLRDVLSLREDTVNEIVASTQSVTAGFNWNTRIRQYRRLLIDGLEQGEVRLPRVG